MKRAITSSQSTSYKHKAVIFTSLVVNVDHEGDYVYNAKVRFYGKSASLRFREGDDYWNVASELLDSISTDLVTTHNVDEVTNAIERCVKKSYEDM